MGKWRDRVRARMDKNDALDAWLAQHSEDILEPELPIVDPHHHLWDDRPEPMARYMLEDVLDDVDSGHNVKTTVFLQCGSMYRSSGPEALRPVGETEFVNGIAAESESGLFGPARIAAGIVGYADLTLGGAVEEVLVRHIQVGDGRFRGIRFSAGNDDDPEVRKHIRRPVPYGLLGDSRVREGFARLAPLGLSFDAWLYFPQLGDIAELARAFPETGIVVDHVGGLLGLGKYTGRRDDVFAAWKQAVGRIAAFPNVTMKLGGLTMKTVGFGFHERAKPPSSQELADAYRPYFETCIDLFGVDRCMFQSNFPVDKAGCSYPVLWNAFKRVTASYSGAEKRALHCATAARVYRLTV
jgi:L-fuconolactonase